MLKRFGLMAAVSTLFFVLLGTGVFATDNPTLDIADGPIYLRTDNLKTQYSRDNASWIDYTGTITITGDPINSTKNTITVESGTHNITLNNVNIDVSTLNDCAFEIKPDATANITLVGTNTLKSSSYSAGLQVPENAVLTITAESLDDSLTATGGSSGAGIGGHYYNLNAGTINIKGGTVNANGGSSGAPRRGGGRPTGGGHGGPTTNTGGFNGGSGIGGSASGNGGTTTISGGTVNATGKDGGAGIGGGSSGNGGTININGGTVTATGSTSTDIGGAGIGGGTYGDGGNITITAGTVNATGGDGTAGAGIGGGGNDGDSGTASSGGTIVISGGTVTATGGDGSDAAKNGDGIGKGGGINTTAGTFKTQADSSPPGNAVIIASSISDTTSINDWNGLIFGGDSSNPNTGFIYDSASDPDSFTLSSNLTIPSGKTLNVKTGQTLTVPKDITLTGNIQNDGIIVQQKDPVADLSTTSVYLKVDGNDKQISYDNSTWLTYTGTVTLNGNTDTNNVQVQSGVHDIVLKGVNINIPGKDNKHSFHIQSNATANITLEGENFLENGEDDAALQVSDGATLIIMANSTGRLTATGGDYAAGIGGKISEKSGNITIKGGIVIAIGGFNGAGIGGGNSGAGGTVEITGGNVTATGRDGGAGIGGGDGGAGGTVKITGGTVTATGGSSHGYYSGGSGIGGGYAGTGGTVEITGGTVTATGGINAKAFSTKPTISLPTTPSASIYSVSVVAGADASGANNKNLSESYDTEKYAKIEILPSTPQIDITLAPVLTYNGKLQTQSVAAKLGGATLTPSTHYTLSDNTATNIGDYTLKINIHSLGTNGVYDSVNGVNYLLGSAVNGTATYTIGKIPLTLASATLGAPLVANGTEQTQSVTSLTLNGIKLVEGTDYTVSGNTATNAGSYAITFTGIGNYTGTLIVPYTVTGNSTGSTATGGTSSSESTATEEPSSFAPTGTLDIANSVVPHGHTLHLVERSEGDKQRDLAKLDAYKQQNGITGTVSFLMDITMTDGNGNKAQPQNNNTRLRINVPGLTAGSSVTVLHIKDDGTVEEIRPIAVYDGYVEFYPQSFSAYSVIVHGLNTTMISPLTGVYNS